MFKINCLALKLKDNSKTLPAQSRSRVDDHLAKDHGYARFKDQRECSRGMTRAGLHRALRFGLVVPYLVCISASLGAQREGESTTAPFVRLSNYPPTAIGYLRSVLEKFHQGFNVYTDADAAGNHFVVKARMSSEAEGDAESLPPMNEACLDVPHSGVTCISATFRVRGRNWGGWYFMNGVLPPGATDAKPNWGEHPRAGVDLRGYDAVEFYVRGAEGGEEVEFFVAGVGYDEAGRKKNKYPDSSGKTGTGFITLGKEWQRHTIDLRGKDLSYVLGGFGWVTNAPQNRGCERITFYIDDIRYCSTDQERQKRRSSDPQFLVSYETIASGKDFDVVLRNAAFIYDNAVACLAFLAHGQPEQALPIADALVYALDHDRFYDDGRLRNAVQAGDPKSQPGWNPKGKEGTARMPGWWDVKKNQWLEDITQVSTSAGNQAWAMLALLACYEKTTEKKYLSAAERLGEWVEKNCRDERGGYTAGTQGWEPRPEKLTYKATEHNIDLYVTFKRLSQTAGTTTAKDTWAQRAEHAKRFVIGMWDAEDGKFWTGTEADGVTIAKNVIPVDVQAWAILALREDGKPYRRALSYAEKHLKAGDGFDFNQDRDGVWFEGTGQMAVAYQSVGEGEKAAALLKFLKSKQSPSGALPAASKDGLTTGFLLPDGQPWTYFRRAHAGATAWLALAEKGFNPFWLGTRDLPETEGKAGHTEPNR